MSEVKMEIKEMTMDICKIIEKLQCGLLAGLSKPEEMQLEEAKEITDMIKDMTEAKEKIVKAVYYEKITEAMEESEFGEDYDEEGPIDRAGYRGRNPRTGRFVSRGRGTGRGYGYTEQPLIYDPIESYRMGYRDGDMNRTMESNGTMNNIDHMGTQSRYGMSYDNYQKARRHYTENPNESNKMRMKNTHDEALTDAINAIRQMYMDADPDQKRKVNNKLTKALQEMPPV